MVHIVYECRTSHSHIFNKINPGKKIDHFWLGLKVSLDDNGSVTLL